MIPTNGRRVLSTRLAICSWGLGSRVGRPRSTDRCFWGASKLVPRTLKLYPGGGGVHHLGPAWNPESVGMICSPLSNLHSTPLSQAPIKVQTEGWWLHLAEWER